MPESSLPSLVSLLRASETKDQDQAWDLFVTEYSRIVLKSARNGASSHDETMDRYTFVLEKLRADDFRRLRGFDPDGRGSFTTWLFLVTRRLCVDHHRHRYGRRIEAEDGRKDEAGPSSPVSPAALARRRLADLLVEDLDPMDLPDPSARNPEVSTWEKERRGILEEGLAALPPRDQLLITLRFVDEVPVRKIARAMRYKSPFQVYRRLKKVLGQLRGHLEEHGVSEP